MDQGSFRDIFKQLNAQSFHHRMSFPKTPPHFSSSDINSYYLGFTFNCLSSLYIYLPSRSFIFYSLNLKKCSRHSETLSFPSCPNSFWQDCCIYQYVRMYTAQLQGVSFIVSSTGDVMHTSSYGEQCLLELSTGQLTQLYILSFLLAAALDLKIRTVT